MKIRAAVALEGKRTEGARVRASSASGPTAMTDDGRSLAVFSMTESFARVTLAAGLLVVAAPTLAQQPYPAPGRIVTVVVPFSLGTGPDILARLMGQQLGERSGASVVVDNKP